MKYAATAALLFAAVLFPAALGAQTAQRATPLEARVKSRDLSFCYIDDKTFTADLDIWLELKNKSKEPLIIGRFVPGAKGRVAVSAAAARDGRFLDDHAGFGGLPADESKPTFGDQPDERFVVLPPGKTYRTTVLYSVYLRYASGPPVPGTLPPGRYAVQLEIGLWPLPPVADEEMTALAKRWEGAGRLFTGPVTTNPVSFRVLESTRARADRCSWHDIVGQEKKIGVRW